MLHTNPIYLRNSRSATLNKEETSNKEEGYVDIIDLLGAYFLNKTKDAPYIELYVDTILNEVNTKGGKFEWLFTKVLIHELAHAALDINNCERYGNVPEKIHYNTPFGKWREESMANAVALRVIRDYGDQSFYDYSEKYMLSQPAKYALGVKMVDFGYWDFRSVIKGKRDGVNKILQDEWLDYVKNGNPTWQGLHGWNDILFDSTVYKYNNKYYTRNENLVLNVILDYIAQNPPMSFSQLNSVFPNTKIQHKAPYHLLDPNLSSCNFFTDSHNILHLTDGDYALSKYWYDKELSNFISIAGGQGINIKIIHNY